MANLSTIAKCTLPTRQRDPVRENGTFLYVDIASINRESKQIEDAKETPCDQAPSRARKEIKTGDVIVSTVRPNLNAVAQVPTSLDNQIASTGFAVLRPNPSLIAPRYLFYRVVHPAFVEEMAAQAKGAGYPAVSDRIVGAHAFPLPLLPEQNRIVEILDQADALRKQRRQADQLSQKVLTALFHEMFGDPATMSKRYPIGTFEDVLISTKNGLYKHADFYGVGVPILKMFNIYQGSLRMDRVDRVTLEPAELKSYRLSVGDILFNRVNTPELVGKCAVIDQNADGAVFESKNIRAILDLKKVAPHFACFFYNTEYGHKELTRRLKHAAGMATITGPHVREAPFPHVPLDLQLIFEKHCQTVAKSWSESVKSTATLEALFQTLLHRAFDGSLTAKWREGHAKEVLQEMEHQSR